MSSTKGLFRILLMLGTLVPLRAQPAEPVRLALLAESAQELRAADLLTVELSQQRSLHLLERNEIEKVLREQALSAANQDRSRVGRLLGADGLLLLQVNKSESATTLAVQLIAVRPAVVLSDWRFVWPLKEPQEWARATAPRVLSFASKLSVLTKDAIPVSVVNLRSAVQTPEGLEAERLLKSLLIHCLIQEPRIFVLERGRMQPLSQEKELNSDGSAFWSGAYLLDATIDPNGYSRETLVVNARLLPPKGGLSLPAIEVGGSRTNLSAVVTNLAWRIKETLRIDSRPSEWNPDAEAARYLEEAQWAFKWGLFPQAVAACEACWALGQQTKAVAELRIRACRELAAPVWGDSHFIRPTAGNSAPDVGKLEPANRALQYFRQGFQTFIAPEAKPDSTWYRLSLNLLSSVSDLLRQFYLVPESRRGHEEQLAELRLLARQVADEIEAHPAYHHFSAKGNSMLIRSGNEARWEYWSGTPDLATVRAAKGAFWYDTPEQSLEVYREFARSGLLHRLRRYLAYRQIIGWTPADQERAPALWRGLIQELSASTNALLRVEGAFAGYADACDNPQQEERARRSLFSVAVENARALHAAGLADQFLEDVERVIPHSGDRVETKLRDTFRADFKSMIEFGAANAKLTVLKGYLTTNTQFEYHQFARLFYRGDYNETEARELLPLIKTYEAQLLQRRYATPPSYVGDWNVATSAVAQTRGALQRWVSPPAFITTTALLPAPASNALQRVTRFWTLPFSLLDDGSDYPPFSIAQTCFRQGKFWMQVLRGHPVRGAFVFSVDPGNFQAESFKVPLDKLGPSAGLEVLGDFVYLSKADGISRYGLKTKVWEALPVPLAGQVPLPGGTHTSYVPGRVRLSVAGGRLFICSEDSIMELAENGQGVRILASTRRRPAMNILDSLESFSQFRYLPPVFEGPHQSLRTLLQGKIYTSDAEGKDWSEIVVLPKAPKGSPFLTFGQGSIFRQETTDHKQRWWLLPKEQSSLELLLADATPPQPTERPRWLLPQGFSSARSLIQFAGGTLWILTGELNLQADSSGQAVLDQQGGHHLTLLKYEKGATEPEVTPLWFELTERDCFSRLMPKLDLHEYATPQGRIPQYCIGPTVFQATPAGLIITGDHVPGFWFLPHPGSRAVPELARGCHPLDATNSLFAAAAAGNLVAVKDALAQGVAVDARNERGMSALMLAARSNRLEVLTFLIQKGADVNARSAAKSGNTVLCFAVEANKAELIKTLLDHGADLNARSGSAEGTALGYAAGLGKKEAAEALLASGADVDGPGLICRDGRTYTPLMCAACRDHAELVELFLTKGAKLDERNNVGGTVLMEAAKMPSAAIVKLLLAKGADVNVTDDKGHTALIFAAYNGRAENVKLLLAAGADPKAQAKATYDFDGRPYDAAEAATMRHYPEIAGLILEAQK